MEIPQKFYKTFGDVRAEAGQGHELKQKLRPQGEFKFHFDSVPAGTHTLDIVSIGVVFPQVSTVVRILPTTIRTFDTDLLLFCPFSTVSDRSERGRR